MPDPHPSAPRTIRLHFAAFARAVDVQATPEMPVTAVYASQSEHEGRWIFFNTSCANPIALWTDDEMKSALRENAAEKPIA